MPDLDPLRPNEPDWPGYWGGVFLAVMITIAAVSMFLGLGSSDMGSGK